MTSFQDKDGCLESYNYKLRKNNKGESTGHLAEIVKKCSNEVVNRSSYDFSYKKNLNPKTKEESTYLHKLETNIQGYKKVTVFHKTLGVPTSILEGGVLTKFSHNPKGLLSKKQSLTEEHVFRYNSCNKVDSVKSAYYKTCKT